MPGRPARIPMITSAHSRLLPRTDATDPNDLPVLLTIAEVAALLRCSVATVRRRIRRSELAAAKVGRRVLVHRQVVLAHFTRCRVLVLNEEVSLVAAPEIRRSIP